ncbi:MAG: sigma-54-dependent Fis family transcriptional regulator [Deltaproteobacteria bacterium]|nr:sigma-54-dependent Fis family transcriptional regulator [Deltaproteobacteria bacterium]
MGHKVMIVDDDPLIGNSLRLLLRSKQQEILVCQSGKQGLEVMEHFHPDVVLLDLRLGDMDGLDVLRQIKNTAAETRVIIITAYGTIENTVLAMREGAFDYLVKPFDNRKVKAVVRKALEYRPVHDFTFNARCRDLEKHRMSEIIAESPQMKNILDTIKLLGQSGDTTVLIEGESGVGKEWVAEYIHFLSPRFEKPFLKLNCACIPETLAESQLFGYTRGAFTDGVKEGKPGLFATAEGGSLLLDEIADLSLSVQSKLLRVIEEGTFFRIGGNREERCNVRIVASTNKNLTNQVRKGEFRQDLYYRLSVVRIVIPPLRERQEGILPLARFFLSQYCRKQDKPAPELSPEAERVLREHGWTGNVRELRNAMERLAVLQRGGIIHPVHLRFLQEEIDSSSTQSEATLSLGGTVERQSSEIAPDMAFNEVLSDHRTYDETIEKRLAAALDETEGNQVKAAKLLGISRAKLRYQLKKYNLL